jgi:prepilin-type N-terminal cleavage/methylation domain-containing protein
MKSEERRAKSEERRASHAIVAGLAIRNPQSAIRNPNDRGFSLVELMGAMVVLLVGLLALASFLASGAALGMQSKDLSIANQLAKETMESVFAARIVGTLNFDSVQNVSRGGVFLDGPQDIRELGRDGLPNTADDGPPLQYIDPGKDNTYGTDDDKVITFERFRREISITNEDPSGLLRRITVKVRFTFKGITSEATLSSLMSPIN